MSVLIKDIDKELYAKFKASAALHGLRLNDALGEALKCWIQNNTPQDAVEIERMRNNATFRRVMRDLLPEHENEWVVISNGEMIDIFKDRLSAIKAIDELHLIEKTNLVSPLTKSKRTITLGFGRKLQ